MLLLLCSQCPPQENTHPSSFRDSRSESSLGSIRVLLRAVLLLFPMSSARWSNGSKDRHGVGDDCPRLQHVVADLLHLVLMRRGSRSEQVTVNKDDFVPVKVLLRLLRTFLPSAWKKERSTKRTLTEAGKLLFGSEFAVSKFRNGYYRTTAGTLDVY